MFSFDVQFFLRCFIETSFNKVSEKFQSNLDFRGDMYYIFPKSGHMPAIICHGNRIRLNLYIKGTQNERTIHDPLAARTIVHLYDRTPRHLNTFAHVPHPKNVNERKMRT